MSTDEPPPPANFRRVIDVNGGARAALLAAHRMFIDDRRMGRAELQVLIDRCHEKLRTPDLTDVQALAAIAGLCAAEEALKRRNDQN